MQSSAKLKSSLTIYLIGWTLINLLQSYFLNVTGDEAYYWIWSKAPAWGYLDHPPMVAWLIKPGYAIFNNELGVRLLFTLLGTASLYLLYRITNPKSFKIFFWISISCVPIHLAGFLALPDVPLIFFSICFLFVLKEYFDTDSISKGIILGLLAACILYSKYHGILLLFAVVLAAPMVFRRGSFWLAVLIGAAAMIPHIIWQMNHDWASIQFHLNERSWWQEPYQFTNTLKYLWIQPLVLGPLIGFFLYYSLFRSKSGTFFDRVLKSIVLVVYLFFFLATFRGGPVHSHWTAMAIPPLLILGIQYFDNIRPQAENWIKWTGLVSLISILTARSLLIYDYLPDSFERDPNHGWEQWAQEIKTEAAGRQLIFLNDFTHAAKYEFYTGERSWCIGTIYDRRSQYDLLENGKDFLGEESLVLSTSAAGLKEPLKEFSVPGFADYFILDEDEIVFYPLIRIESLKSSYEVADSLEIKIKVLNEIYSSSDLNKNSSAIPKLGYQIFQQGATVIEIRTELKIEDIQNSDAPLNLPILLPPKPGKYKVKLCVYTDQTPPTQNSRVIDIEVLEEE